MNVECGMDLHVGSLGPSPIAFSAASICFKFFHIFFLLDPADENYTIKIIQ